MKNQIKIKVLETKAENKRNNYKVVISYKGHEFETVFHDSIYNYEHGIGLNTDDVIYSILTDAWAYDSCRDVEDFGHEFGYDIYDELEDGYNSELLRVYAECHKTSKSIHEMFSDSELDELNQEFAEY
jgi:hypothetical protein